MLTTTQNALTTAKQATTYSKTLALRWRACTGRQKPC